MEVSIAHVNESINIEPAGGAGAQILDMNLLVEDSSGFRLSVEKD